MKKALIDQIMLGFFIFAALIIFGTTVSDEFAARNKVYTLDELAQNLTRAIAKHYMYHEDIQEAQNIANNILSQTNTGMEVLNNNLVTYTWKDLTGNGEPDTITTTIDGYIQDNFWYRFLNKDSFALPKVEYSSYITKEESDITSIYVTYGGSNAGYYNMIGTYELDANDCVTNIQLILANKDDYAIGDELTTFTNTDTRFFIIANGYNLYGNNVNENDSVEVTGCIGDENSPNITIDGVSNAAPIYFQDTELNSDNGYDHMHEIAKTYFDDYEAFINTPIEYCSRYRSGNCTQYSQRDATWEDWESYAQENSIDYEEDPNDEYIITMEDLPNGGDKDFNDINLDTTKIRTPKTPTQEDLDNGIVL